MMLPIQLNDMPRGSGKSPKAAMMVRNSKTKSILLVPPVQMKRFHIQYRPMIEPMIFTFDEFLKPDFLMGAHGISKVVIDEGLGQGLIEKTMFGILYKCGMYHMTVEIFGTSEREGYNDDYFTRKKSQEKHTL